MNGRGMFCERRREILELLLSFRESKDDWYKELVSELNCEACGTYESAGICIWEREVVKSLGCMPGSVRIVGWGFGRG